MDNKFAKIGANFAALGVRLSQEATGHARMRAQLRQFGTNRVNPVQEVRCRIMVDNAQDLANKQDAI